MKKVALIAFLLFCPAFMSLAQAQVKITEIMYDPPGTDTAFEWIEIHNSGSAEIDLSRTVLFEEGSRHKLRPIIGTTTLAASEYAIIADDAEKFRASFPSFRGGLFDSVFSLKNTGELLMLKDGEKDAEVVLDQVTYDPSLGAVGDGNSLQFSISEDRWLAIQPTPGTGLSPIMATQGGTTSPVVTSAPETVSTAPMLAPSVAVSSQPKTIPVEPQIFVKIKADAGVLAGVERVYSADAWGLKKEPLQNARYIWNLGDGKVKEGRQILHAFAQPGDYTVFLEAASGEYSATDRTLMKVVAPDLRLELRSDHLEIKNATPAEVDLQGTVLKHPAFEFFFPNHSLVSAKGTGKFPFTIFGLKEVEEAIQPTQPFLSQLWQLQYLSGQVIATTTWDPPETKTEIKATVLKKATTASKTKKASVIKPPATNSAAASFAAPRVISLDSLAKTASTSSKKPLLRAYGPTVLVFFLLAAASWYFFAF